MLKHFLGIKFVIGLMQTFASRSLQRNVKHNVSRVNFILYLQQISKSKISKSKISKSKISKSKISKSKISKS